MGVGPIVDRTLLKMKASPRRCRSKCEHVASQITRAEEEGGDGMNEKLSRIRQSTRTREANEY